MDDSSANSTNKVLVKLLRKQLQKFFLDEYSLLQEYSPDDQMATKKYGIRHVKLSKIFITYQPDFISKATIAKHDLVNWL